MKLLRFSKLLPLVVLLGSVGSPVAAEPAGSFVVLSAENIPGLVPGLTGHTATLLKDGRVLIAGGQTTMSAAVNVLPTTTIYANAALFDPSTGAFTSAGLMTTPRVFHTATLLRDGRVLITGGRSSNSVFEGVGTAEIYNPATGAFARTGDMAGRHWFDNGIQLKDGRVLIGGVDSGTGELFDPASGAFTHLTANLDGPAVALNDGRVLIAAYNAISLYEVTADSLTLLSSQPVNGTSLFDRSVTLLGDGKVLIAGGDEGYDAPTTDAALLFDPETGVLRSTGSMVVSREGHTASLLPGGRVFVAGGYNSGDYATGVPGLGIAEEYDPSTEEFKFLGYSWEVHGESHTATLLPNGTVLVVGGFGSFHNVVELYVPAIRSGSAASFSGPLAPDSLASLFGSQLAWTSDSADAVLPPTSLGGVKLLVHDSAGAILSAPLMYVSPSQINFVVPAGTAPGNASLEIVRPPNDIPMVAAQVAQVAPGIFTFPENIAVAYGVRVEPDGSRTILPAQSGIVLDSRPVYLVVYATGVRNRSSVDAVRITVGGIDLSAQYAGPSDGVEGLDQVNLLLSPALQGRGPSQLTISVDGINSNTTTINFP